MALKSTVLFDDLGGNTATINGPVNPQSITLLPRTVSDRTANHTKFSYQLTSTKIREWKFTFSSLTTAQKKDLLDFFTDTAIGPTNTFSYTHTDGTTYTGVRFKNDELNFTRTEPGRFSVDITLELASNVDGDS